MEIKINYYDTTTKLLYPLTYTSYKKNESEAWLEICRLINSDERFIKVYPSQFKIVSYKNNKHKRIYKYRGSIDVKKVNIKKNNNCWIYCFLCF